ncbi:MAG: hypothetical protein HDT38_02635 [Clostridiales bacterium]|nr:hypothetical protein [Clostridiales bacterium]
MKRIKFFSSAAAYAPQQAAEGGLDLDRIVKYGVFHTRAGFARLKNSVAIFQFI